MKLYVAGIGDEYTSAELQAAVSHLGKVISFLGDYIASLELHSGADAAGQCQSLEGCRRLLTSLQSELHNGGRPYA